MHKTTVYLEAAIAVALTSESGAAEFEAVASLYAESTTAAEVKTPVSNYNIHGISTCNTKTKWTCYTCTEADQLMSYFNCRFKFTIT